MGDRKGFESNLREGGTTEKSAVRGNCNQDILYEETKLFSIEVKNEIIKF